MGNWFGDLCRELDRQLELLAAESTLSKLARDELSDMVRAHLIEAEDPPVDDVELLSLVRDLRRDLVILHTFLQKSPSTAQQQLTEELVQTLAPAIPSEVRVLSVDEPISLKCLPARNESSILLVVLHGELAPLLSPPERSLIAHEVAHLDEEISAMWQQSVKRKRVAETCCDLVAVSMLGPAFCEGVAEYAGKVANVIESRPGDVHPCWVVRGVAMARYAIPLWSSRFAEPSLRLVAFLTAQETRLGSSDACILGDIEAHRYNISRLLPKYKADEAQIGDPSIDTLKLRVIRESLGRSGAS